MFDKVSRSWALSKQSWSVLRSDKQLVLFPLLSSLACILVLISFAVPVFFAVDWTQFQNASRDNPPKLTPAYYVGLFLFYFVNYFVIAFFNAGLIGCAMKKFEGEEVSVGLGLRIAASRLPQILGWALISATIGMILRAISERAGLIGKIVISLIGFVWTIATYFVVPVLVVEKVGPIEAVKRSAGIIKKTWGETIVINVGLGALSMVGFLVSLVPLFVGVGLTIAFRTVVPVIAGGLAMLLMLVTLALISSTLSVILTAALYRYAATGLVPEQFDGQLLKQMFRNKKDKD
jgi:hypothetical protein